MKNLCLLLGSFVLAFGLTACDQQPTEKQADCTKPLSQMTDQEKNFCGLGGEVKKSPEKKW